MRKPDLVSDFKYNPGTVYSLPPVLRMLSEYVGEEKFLKGVSIYLKQRLYGSSVTKDLWDGISEATGM